MAVNESLSNLSNTLFTTAIATYAVAFIGYTAEYAFGRRGRVAESAAVPVPSRVLVGGAGLADADDRPAAADVASAGRSRAGNLGNRFGRAAVVITVIGAAAAPDLDRDPGHARSTASRGRTCTSSPRPRASSRSSRSWSCSARAPQMRYLGLFVMFPVVVLMFLAGTVLYSQASPLVPALQSYWLAIHVTAAASSEGVLMTSSVLTILYLIRRQLRRADGRRPADRGSPRIGARLPAAVEPRQERLPAGRVRVPDLHVRRHRRRDLGRGGLGPVLGLGPEGDLGLHRLGRLRRLPARPRDRRLPQVRARGSTCSASARSRSTSSW